MAEVLGVECTNLPKILELIAQHPIVSTGPKRGLPLLRMQTVLSAMRASADPSVAAGALYMLLGSNFLNMVKTRDVVRMLEADANFADVGAWLFAIHRRRGEDKSRVSEIAEAIVYGSSRVSHATAVAAARFLAVGKADPLPPLKSVIQTGGRLGEGEESLLF